MAWESTKNSKGRDIIKILGDSESLNPTQIAQRLNLHKVVVSRYLKKLKDDKLVKILRKQNQLYYSLNLDEWKKHVETTMNLAGENFANKFKDHLEKESSNQKIRRNL